MLVHRQAVPDVRESGEVKVCDGCNRPAAMDSPSFPGGDVCCEACDADWMKGEHTPACDRRVGNRCELAFGYLAWLAH